MGFNSGIGSLSGILVAPLPIGKPRAEDNIAHEQLFGTIILRNSLRVHGATLALGSAFPVSLYAQQLGGCPKTRSSSELAVLRSNRAATEIGAITTRPPTNSKDYVKKVVYEVFA